jgi:hypothetical protein
MEEWEDVYPTEAEIAWLYGEAHREPALERTPVRIVDFSQFVATEEPSAEPLLGTAADTLLPLDGMLLMYGDGGAGKTTLTIDAVAHLASGTSWLGIDVDRAVRTLMIENEGPRGKFRQRLAEKLAAWQGAPFHMHVTVLEDPWTRFTLRDETHRQAVAQTIDERELDLVVMGPLVTLGMLGGGTPDEVSEFEELLRQLKATTARPFALWIIHHENKAGDVSGAWERVPDCLCHVQAQGNGFTRLVFRKARWADAYHGVSLDLVWGEGRTYEVRGDEEIDHHAELLQAFAESNEWRTVKEAAKLISRKEKPTADALSDLVDRGEMEFAKGPNGRSHRAQCYRLCTAPSTRAQYGAVRPIEGFDEGTAPLRPPYKETVGSRRSNQNPATAPTSSGAVDDEIPF